MLCQQLTEARARPKGDTYTSAFNVNDLTRRLRRFHDGDCLDGSAIAEPGALAIDDTRDVYVRVHAMFLSGFDHLVVRADSLVRVSIGILDNHHWTDEWTYRLHGRERRLRALLYLVEALIGIADDPVSRVASEAAEKLRSGRVKEVCLNGQLSFHGRQRFNEFELGVGGVRVDQEEHDGDLLLK
jgi:hypothetical protein